MKTTKNYLILAAAGNGSRMNNEIPKQYIEINGKPMIVWTLEAFKLFIEIDQIIIVISKFHEQYWDEITKYYPQFKKCKVTFGGPTRFHSIKSGLKYVPINTLVAIHDAARPMVNKKTIEDCFKVTENKGNAIPVISCNESLRQKTGNHNKWINRDEIKIVQTPQIFKSEILKDAYQLTYDEFFTDDASIVEKYGMNINLTEGNPENIKVTTNFDLRLASLILSSSSLSTDME